MVMLLLETSRPRRHRAGRLEILNEVARGASTAVVMPCGHLVHGDEVAGLRAYLEQLLALGYRAIDLDLSNVIGMDAAGLGLLVYAEKLAHVCHSRIRVTGLPVRVKELWVLFRICHLTGG